VPGDGTFDAVPGYVRVYSLRLDDGSWSQLGEDIVGEASNDRFGSTVALSGDGSILAVGGFGNDGDLNVSSVGHVRVFRYAVDAGFVQLGNDIDGEERLDETGRTIDLSSDGSVLAVGSRNASPRVFLFSNGAWSLVGDLTSYESSSSVALSSNGNVLAVGDSGDNTAGLGSGIVRVFRYATTTDWLQIGNGIVGGNSEDEAGYSVALSSTGMILAIGAPSSKELAPRAGNVRLFEYVDRDWVQLGTTIQGTHNGDSFGYSVSLSDNGKIVAIGVRLDNGVGESAGKVVVYYFEDGDWVQLGGGVNGEDAFNLFGSAVSLSGDGTTFAAGSPIGDYVSVYQVE